MCAHLLNLSLGGRGEQGWQEAAQRSGIQHLWLRGRGRRGLGGNGVQRLCQRRQPVYLRVAEAQPGRRKTWEW